jgi:hypothetical protein
MQDGRQSAFRQTTEVWCRNDDPVIAAARPGKGPKPGVFCQNLLVPHRDKPAIHVLLRRFEMRVVLSIAAVGAVVVTGVIAATAGLSMATSAIVMAAERPSFEMKALPITPVQVQVLGGAGVQKRAPVANLTVAGMPASPVQIAVLTPRRQHVASR